MSAEGSLPTSKFKKRLSETSLKLDVDTASEFGCCVRCRRESIESDYSNYEMGAARLSESDDEEDVFEEGKELFQNFVREEIHREGLEEPRQLQDLGVR